MSANPNLKFTNGHPISSLIQKGRSNLVKKLSKSPKISIIVSDLSSKGAGRWGGASRPFLLKQALEKLGYQVNLVGLAYDHGLPLEFPTHFAYISPCAYYTGGITFYRKIQELLPYLDGDIIYAIKVKPSSFGIGLIRKYLSKRPLILDIDDWEMSWYGGDAYRYINHWKGFVNDLILPQGSLKHPDHPLYLQYLEKWINQADRLTVHSQFIQKRFGGVYLPNGKDIEHFNPHNYSPELSRQKYDLTSYRLLMFPGAPRPYKGLEDVLMALEILNQPDLRLVIVGGSPYDDYDRQLHAKWAKWLIILPKLPIEKMPEIVAAAHIIVIPQRDHPAALAQFPLKLTDGMAMAKPILSTMVGDIPAILSNAGYLVPPQQPAAIAQQIDWIFNHWSEAEEKGQMARQRCVEHYSIEAMSKVLATLITEL